METPNQVQGFQFWSALVNFLWKFWLMSSIRRFLTVWNFILECYKDRAHKPSWLSSLWVEFPCLGPWPHCGASCWPCCGVCLFCSTASYVVLVYSQLGPSSFLNMFLTACKADEALWQECQLGSWWEVFSHKVWCEHFISVVFLKI